VAPGPAGEIPLERARRIALGAQGFTDRRPEGRVDRRHLRRVIGRVGLIQIDSVNVLVRSQELALFSRLGPHPRALLDDAVRDRELFEYWVHEASFVPVELHPLLRWSMTGSHRWKGLARFRAERGRFVEEIYARVRDEGPLTAADLRTREGPKGPWWDWDDAKAALECLFFEGRLTSAGRGPDFARVYDLTERVLPADVLGLPTPSEAEARKELLVLAARHHGIGTLADLADYHRQRNPPCRPLVHELVEEGRLIRTSVDGWSQPAYVHPEAVAPRRVPARALLSPFDPVVWFRDRVHRLFGFHYRIEIYVPRTDRRYGYYVLPFLLGDRLVARVDLKSDRGGGRLLVLGAYAEPDVDEDAVASALLVELTDLAEWLGLPAGVHVRERGDLATVLERARFGRV
jgi:hypothetical protein